MRRFVKRLIIFILLLVSLAAAFLYQRIVGLESVSVTDDVAVIYGAGGNVGVLRTDHGAVIVDTMTFAMQGRRIRELAERIGGGPTQLVINTHYHQDHTHGNPGFAGGTAVISTQRTRDYLDFFDSEYWSGDRAENLPSQTFDERETLQIGAKTISLVFPGRGHTGGDLVALFVEDRVLHTGDLFFNQRYPRIDLPAGGSLREWIATIDRVLELEFDRVIPGHGPVSDRAGLVRFQDFLRDVWDQTRSAVADGMTLEEALSTIELRHDDGYSPGGVPILYELNRESVIRQAWEEASGSVSALQIPESPS